MPEERVEKNAVFSGGQGPPIDPRFPTQSAAEKVKAEFGLDIPTELVPLPSGGRVYPKAFPFHGKDTVEITPMTAREEDILTSRALMKKGTVISELIRSCLVDKSVNVVDLLVGDRNALMVAIRATGYGTEYDAEIECGDCNVKAPQQFDLGALPIKHLVIDPVEEGTNVFQFRLPLTKKNVKFRFLTGRDEEEIVITQDRQKKQNLGSAETGVTTNLLYSLVSIENVDDRQKIAGFVRAMPARDSLALRNYIRDNEPGITMKQEVTCPSCHQTELVNIPIGISFFWPGAVS